MSVILLAVVALAHMAPDAMQAMLGGSIKAWEYVFRGVQGGALWLLLASTSHRRDVWAVCLYGAWESASEAMFRAMLPMDKAPHVPPGQSLGDVATGLPVSYLSPVLVCIVAAVVVHELARPQTGPTGNAQNKVR